MSKQQPPADDKEVLRQLTKEAHEAVRDLTQLLREIRRAKAELPATAEKLIEDATCAHMDEVNACLNQAITDINAVIRKEEERTREHYGELLGRDGADLIMRTCGMVLHLAVPTITMEDWMEKISEISTERRAAGCTCLGCTAAAAAFGADIIVTTPDMVDQVRAMDPERIIIDGR